MNPEETNKKMITETPAVGHLQTPVPAHMGSTDDAERLEAMVVLRTKALTDRITELEATNRSMVDRELRMVELKKEIEGLKKVIDGGAGTHKNGD